jgi:hypothetical protein
MTLLGRELDHYFEVEPSDTTTRQKVPLVEDTPLHMNRIAGNKVRRCQATGNPLRLKPWMLYTDVLTPLALFQNNGTP